jgi:hypothetical protein
MDPHSYGLCIKQLPYNEAAVDTNDFMPYKKISVMVAKQTDWR